jgi:DGQHR domain-containing protein
MSVEIENVLKIEDPSGVIFYLGSITPDQILQVTFVPSVINTNSEILNVRTEEGYQREGDKKRMKLIKEFYSSNLRSLIPPVLLATRGNWEFKSSSKNSVLGKICANDCAAIIDGQHRLGGLSLLAKEDNVDSKIRQRNIPFMAVDFADIAEESNEFEVINGKQKGIRPSHLKYIRRDQTFTGNASNLLKEDDESVFKNRIAIAERADSDLITFQAAGALVDSIFDHYFCTNTNFRPATNNDDIQQKAMSILIQYWSQVATVFDAQWADIEKLPLSNHPKSAVHPGRGKFQYRLLEETGLRAFAKLGSKILYKAWLPVSNEIAWTSVTESLTKVATDDKVKLVLQKINDVNRESILGLNPRLIQQGIAGVQPLLDILGGALDRRVNE